MKKTHLECGKIINTHGFRGTVKLESWCDAPEVLAGLDTIWFVQGNEYRPCRVLRASVFKQFVLMDLEGIDSEERANALRNTVVWAARADLPLEAGDFFIVDLLGLPVIHADSGEFLGELTDIKSGATDLYTVRTEKGDFLVPAVPEFVVKIDPDKAVYVRPIPGLLDGGAENV
ncbi:MAG: 16S rRNA processing protein RimM [Ruminococcaceae bacterium]|nr:16S rRNA processing protein RimM [Oscillospiraceae bacterium]